jgi:hypothetical protein
MSYCAETDIETELQKQFTASTELTSTEIATIIANVDVLIDSRLSGKYVTPITGTKALTRIKDIATQICSGRVEAIYGFNARYVVDEVTKERVPYRLAEGMRSLRQLVKGEATLIFETAADSAVLKCTNQKVASSYDDDIHESHYTDFGSNYRRDRY